MTSTQPQPAEVGSLFGSLARGFAAASTLGASEAAIRGHKALTKKKKKPAAKTVFAKISATPDAKYDIRKMTPDAIALYQRTHAQLRPRPRPVAGGDVIDMRSEPETIGGGDVIDMRSEPETIGAESTAALVPFASFADALQVRRNEVGAAVATIRKEFFRHRVDWHWLPNGHIEAILTVSLPDGHEFRFRAQADPHEIAEALRAQHPEVGGFMSSLWKGIKKVAKSVATSKVFKLASTALMAAAPALGPLAPTLLAAGAGMKAASALLAARSLQAKGQPAAAATLVEFATKASKAVAIIAPPRASRTARNPHAAAVQTHVDAARASSGKLYRLLLQPTN